MAPGVDRAMTLQEYGVVHLWRSHICVHGGQRLLCSAPRPDSSAESPGACDMPSQANAGVSINLDAVAPDLHSRLSARADAESFADQLV